MGSVLRESLRVGGVMGFWAGTETLRVYRLSIINSPVLGLRNSGGGDIRFWVEPRNGLTGVWMPFDRLGDLGDVFGEREFFDIVAYKEPSRGPWVWDDAVKRKRIK